MGDDAELYMETGGEPSILCDNEDDFSYTEEESIDFTSISSECKRCFFVDYENVNRVGLNGILKLSETDCVRIYY
ncbi:MAG: NYN domain-containing protein, partial [Ruminococcus callidus]|nr:NYN domain-containing protein [Ruminococcus callidus]